MIALRSSAYPKSLLAMGLSGPMKSGGSLIIQSCKMLHFCIRINRGSKTMLKNSPLGLSPCATPQLMLNVSPEFLRFEM